MVLIKRRQNEQALQLLNEAYHALKRLISVVNDRRQRTLGDPLYFNPSAAYDATFDTATGFAMAEDLESAVSVFAEVHGEVFPPSIAFLENDPALMRLRCDSWQFNKWLRGKKA